MNTDGYFNGTASHSEYGPPPDEPGYLDSLLESNVVEFRSGSGREDGDAARVKAGWSDGLDGLEFPRQIELDTASNALVKGIIAPGDLVALYGPSGVGKTFVSWISRSPRPRSIAVRRR